MTHASLARLVRPLALACAVAVAAAPARASAQDRLPAKRPPNQPATGPVSGPPGGGPTTGPMTGPRTGPPTPGGAADRLTAMERQDLGVAPTRDLHTGPMHGPTPASIPGAQVITTRGVQDLMRQGVPHLIIDVLGAPPPDRLPNALPGEWMAAPGSFDDQVQQQVVQGLRQVTQGRTDMPLVFYCRSRECWMSYNAALRAVRAGYTNVLWYRGGVEAWKMASAQ